MHDECLVEEDVLDRVEWVWLQETEGLDEKCGQEGGKKCGLDCTIESVRSLGCFMDFLGQAYKDEDAIIEEILPLAFAVVVFDGSDTEVVLPSSFWSVLWICKRSDWVAVGQVDLLSGGPAIGKSELASRVGILLY